MAEFVFVTESVFLFFYFTFFFYKSFTKVSWPPELMKHCNELIVNCKVWFKELN